MKKRGQVSVFMIVAIVLLIGGIVFFSLTRQEKTEMEPEIKIIEEQVPVEFDPIRKYATDCAYYVGVEGLKIIGKQGGYISFTDKSLNRESFTITNNPTETDVVSFTTYSDLKIPYWWYLKSANNCKDSCAFASKRPDLRQSDNSVEKQLERYVDMKFKQCLGNFEPFAEQGFKITEKGKVKSDVIIASNDVALVIQYPLSVQKGETTSSITQFVVNIPVNLEKLYELATKITNLEMQYHYLEKHVLNLIVAFSGVDRQKLPPMSDLQFKFGSTMSWQKSDIKNKITGLLASYVPLFQIDGTYNYQRNLFDSELRQRLYDSTIIPVANSSYENIAAEFTYLDFWPAYFDLNCNGEQCVPSSANSLISFFGIQDYSFVYDLSFPVLVELDDPFALNGQGYTFNLFLEGNIRNNKPLASNSVQLDLPLLSEKSLLCDSRTSGNVTVSVANAASKKPVQDAQVLYTVTGESCFIGTTNSNGIVKEVFPGGAIGGYVNVVRDEFIGKTVEFDAKVGQDSSLSVAMNPIYIKNLVVKKKNVVKTANGWVFDNKEVELNDKETATVVLTRGNDGSELDFSAAGVYEGQQKAPSEMQIAPGTYAADINLLLDERIVIPEQRRCYKKGIFGSEECVTIPKIDFGEGASSGSERFPEGGLKLNFTINANDLEKYDTIVLYAVSIDLASVPEQNRVVEDVDQIGKIEDYSHTYQIALQPKFE